MKPALLLLAAFAMAPPAAPATNPDLLTKPWKAQWIAPPDASPRAFGVFHFRRSFELRAKPATFLVHVTGDNRYQLFVNGTRVVWGPARGDLSNWRYESVDISPHLRAGKNVLAAVAWNFGQQAPMAQVTSRTGFLLEGNTAAEEVVNTGPNWRCVENRAYQPIAITTAEMRGYYVVGPGEKVDFAQYPWGWEQPAFDDSSWKPAQALGPGLPRSVDDKTTAWMLVPREIPLMEETAQRIQRVRRAAGMNPPAAFPLRPAACQVPARAKAELVLDQDSLTTAYPELVVSGGKGATVTVKYIEAPYSPGSRQKKGTREKPNRNEIEGMELDGNRDVFIADGGKGHMFRTLWWRTWRYIELTIETGNEPLTIEDFRSVYTGYPFVRRAKLDAGSAELAKILDVGWHTARLCAHETYMDCPYWEQLQYAGDTRIQGLVSLYMTGDARLLRNAIKQLDASRNSTGITRSQAPSRMTQIIPGFSLWWIGMVHDYWMYQDDPNFVREMLPGVRAVLSFFAGRRMGNGSVGKVGSWNYVDWTEWNNGSPPLGADGSSSLNDLQAVLAYQWAARMEEALAQTVRSRYYDGGRRLFADVPEKDKFSQQANVLAVLAGVVSGNEAGDLIDRINNDRQIAQCSIYFRHYLNSALNKAGGGDRYLDYLEEWRRMLSHGLTTWAETADPTRSDCHAWGSSPNFELFRTVLGIDSAAPGFRRVIIQPFLGKLNKVSGSIPHPKGELSVSLERRGSQLNAEIRLPAGVEGEFVWQGRSYPLRPGTTRRTF